MTVAIEGWSLCFAAGATATGCCRALEVAGALEVVEGLVAAEIPVLLTGGAATAATGRGAGASATGGGLVTAAVACGGVVLTVATGAWGSWGLGSGAVAGCTEVGLAELVTGGDSGATLAGDGVVTGAVPVAACWTGCAGLRVSIPDDSDPLFCSDGRAGTAAASAGGGA